MTVASRAVAMAVMTEARAVDMDQEGQPSKSEVETGTSSVAGGYTHFLL